MARRPEGDDELRVNDLERFSKRSSKLVLEQFSHCEAPAGCGGAVLRWRDPAEGLPAFVKVAAPATVTAFLDGREQKSGATMLSHGGHLLALHLRREGSGPDLMLALVQLEAPEWSASGRVERRLHGTSADGSWRLSTVDPGEGWAERDFDDRRFGPMTAAAFNLEQLPKEIRWRYLDLEQGGAVALALPSRVKELWVRSRFRLEPSPLRVADDG